MKKSSLVIDPEYRTGFCCDNARDCVSSESASETQGAKLLNLVVTEVHQTAKSFQTFAIISTGGLEFCKNYY
jgi:predicted metal-binding protein